MEHRVAEQRSRLVVLARHVDGVPRAADFSIETGPVPRPGADGEFVVRNSLVSVDPGTRGRLSPGPSYAAILAPGEVVGAFALGEVIESRHPDWPPGTVVTTASGWREHSLETGRGYLARIAPSDLPLAAWLGVLGVSGMTAWFGLNRVAEMQAGDVVLVTSAAGPVGATAGQIARLQGGTVVGIAGGPAKCRWLVETAGFDAAIDRQAEADLAAAIADACPDGIDVLFDNVGNAMVDMVLPLMRRNGRIVVSGQLADYNRPPAEVPGIRNTRVFITQRVRMQGLVVFDDVRRFADAQQRMAAWIEAGDLVWRESVSEGIESLPAAFVELFTTGTFGRRLVRLAPDPKGR